MSFKYHIQKLLGRWLDYPVIPEGKQTGYSLMRSVKAGVEQGKHTRLKSPYFLQDVRLGDYSYVSKNGSINHCTIGKFCSIGPNFCCGLGIHPTEGISTAPMFYSTAGQNGMTLCRLDKTQEYLPTTIGNDVFIGANVTVLDGVTIGDGAVIGAGAVVTADIPPYAIAVGVPARVVKYRFSEEIIGKLLQIKWWDGDDAVLARVERQFDSVEQFIEEMEGNQ